MRLLIDDAVAYDGDSIPVPRAGDVFRYGGGDRTVEAVTWGLDNGALSVVLVLAAQPYAY